DATPRRLVHIGLAIPDFGVPSDRERVERGRRARLVCGDRHRQRTTRIPARGAGAVRDRARLPRRRGPCPRADQRLAMLSPVTATNVSSRAPTTARPDLLVVAGMV